VRNGQYQALQIMASVLVRRQKPLGKI